MPADPLIVTVAPLGAELAPGDTPHLIYEPAAFAEMTARCAAAGASIVHIHCRDAAGRNVQTVAAFDEVRRRIAAMSDIIIQFSSGGAVGMTADERASPLSLRPPMATLTCGTVNFGDEVFMNSLPMMRRFATLMREYGVMPELEIFDYGHIANAKRLLAEGLLPDRVHVDFVLGVPGAAEGTVGVLAQFAAALPADWTWSVAGIGRAQLPLCAAAIAMGGHVRVGLEDNRYYSKGRFATNEELVERVVRIARELDRPVATVGQARALLGLRNPMDPN